jgi:hypothetical protein
MLRICELLAGNLALGSLAAVNMVNRETRTLSLPLLYETVVLDQDTDDVHLTRLQKWTAQIGEKRAYIKYAPRF